MIEALLSETVACLQRGAGNSESLRAAVFLFLNRAYEAGMDPDAICDSLGVMPDSVLKRAGLSPEDEAAILEAYALLDPILEQQYRGGIPPASPGRDQEP